MTLRILLYILDYLIKLKITTDFIGGYLINNYLILISNIEIIT